MGNVLWIIEEGLEGGKSNSDLWALYRFSEELDKICDEVGVPRLTTFHDYSVSASEFDEEMEPTFSNASGLLASLTKVRDVVANSGMPFTFGGKARRSDVLHDLDEAIRVAGDCESKGKRVRLSVIP